MLATLIGVGRGNVVGPPPDRDLLDAVLVDGLLLVQPLEAAVVAFIELPGFVTGIHMWSVSSRAWSNVLMSSSLRYW